MQKLVFLGGTCGNNQWRGPFSAKLTLRGVKPEYLFDPVVKDWNTEAQAREEQAKRDATHLMFYIANPMQDGSQISGYSMVEATMSLYDRRMSTVVVFDTTGMAPHVVKSMQQCERVLRARFPDAMIFGTPDEAADWLIPQLT